MAIQDRSKQDDALGASSDLLDLLASELNAEEPADEVCSARVSELERRLAERNRLVEILTERLEQAADQIDRLQRSGGALKSDAPAGLSPEFLNEHRELAQRIESFHSAWEERYEGPSLRRIEASLADLAERFDELRPVKGPMEPAITSFLNQIERDEHDDGEASGIDCEREAGPAVRPREKSARASGPTGRIEIVLLTPTDEHVPDDVPLPAAIDVEEATPGDLHDAVIQRDRYLSWLCQKVRTIASRLDAWLKLWESNHEGAPSNDQFGELRQLIHSQIQVLEVELSIERAKLFREQSRLEQEQERLTREREQFAKERGHGASGENDTALMKRWKRFMQPE
ncbi:hypothetical protein GC176_10015 [bacterium]|nr:hypothetical protein [bacterium]